MPHFLNCIRPWRVRPSRAQRVPKRGAKKPRLDGDKQYVSTGASDWTEEGLVMSQFSWHSSRVFQMALPLLLLLVSVLWDAPMGFATEPPAVVPSAPEQLSHPAEDGGIQERGVTKGALGTLPRKLLERRRAPQPGGSPPSNLCHEKTKMLTQCKCFNQAECQALTTICPGSCPVGSQSCQCVPLFRGTPPPLPPNLCGYQVPLVITECSCHNVAECQLLSPFCPGSCPAGSQSCTCTPLQRR